jgi:hypothetical protein
LLSQTQGSFLGHWRFEWVLFLKIHWRDRLRLDDLGLLQAHVLNWLRQRNLRIVVALDHWEGTVKGVNLRQHHDLYLMLELVAAWD